jgi:hypothetical protein
MMLVRGALCLELHLDVSSSFPLCIGPFRTSKIVKISSEYCTMVKYLVLLPYVSATASCSVAVGAHSAHACAPAMNLVVVACAKVPHPAPN